MLVGGEFRRWYFFPILPDKILIFLHNAIIRTVKNQRILIRIDGHNHTALFNSFDKSLQAGSTYDDTNLLHIFRKKCTEKSGVLLCKHLSWRLISPGENQIFHRGPAEFGADADFLEELRTLGIEIIVAE